MTDAHVWVVRAPVEIADTVKKASVVAIGWREMGDLAAVRTREEIGSKVQSVYGITGPRARVWVGQLYRFVSQIKIGDIVLTPLKLSREVLIGEISSEYAYAPRVVSPEYPNIHRVRWLKPPVSRDDLSVPFRNSIGGLSTIFNVDAHSEEVNKLLGREVVKVESAIEAEDEGWTTDIYEDIKERTKEMVSDLLSKIDPFDFQNLVAGLLKATGFRILRVSTPGPDGGFDIEAARDIFGFEQPRVKVQVKRRKEQATGPEVQQLAGVTGATHKLFVSMSGFTAPAISEAAKHSEIARMDGDQLVDLLLEHYERLDPESQAMVPLRRVYILAKPGT